MLEALVWLHSREKMEGEGKRDKEGKSFYGKICSIDKKVHKLLYFRLEEASNSYFFMKMSRWRGNFA
jgi:hypothetical protein